MWWGPVACLNRNGEIIGYSVRYWEIGSGSGATVQLVPGNITGGMTVISGLMKERVHTVELATVTSAGTGVYSHPLTFGTSDSKLAKALPSI